MLFRSELVRAMRGRPGQISCGATTSGYESPDLAQSMFLTCAKVRADERPSPVGGGARVVAVLGRDLAFGFVNMHDAIAMYRGGAIRVLAVSGPTRVPELPAVPTFTEEGYDVTIGIWRALAVPKRTPWPIVGRLSSALQQALANQSLQAEISGLGQSMVYRDAAAMQQFVRNEYTEFGTLFTALGKNIRSKTAG